MTDIKAIEDTKYDIINAQWEYECDVAPVLHVEDIACGSLDESERLLLAMELNRATRSVRIRWADLLGARAAADKAGVICQNLESE